MINFIVREKIHDYICARILNHDFIMDSIRGVA